MRRKSKVAPAVVLSAPTFPVACVFVGSSSPMPSRPLSVFSRVDDDGERRYWPIRSVKGGRDAEG